jgi:hypothetical protein
MTISEGGGLPQWRDYLDAMAGADALLGKLADPADPLARQEVYRLLFTTVASGLLGTFTDPDLPDFVPAVNSVLNSVGTNPDFIYASATIDGTGRYRLSGERGEGLFLLFDLIAGGLGVNDELGPSVGTIDADTLTLRDGRFDLLLSTEKPDSYAGDWFQLDSRARTLSVRQAAYDWGGHREARLAIERLDRPIAPRRPDAAEIAQRLSALAAYPLRYGSFAMSYGEGQRARGLINKLEHDDWAGRGGLAGQHYYQGIFRLAPGEALVIETELPERVRYWNIQLNDPLWNTIDWFNRQSSLNGGQAALDPDGRFRAVIAIEDPGVPNWLDPGGHSEGSLMLRWTEASSGPEPKLTLVPARDVRAHLHPQTATVSPDERQAALRARRRAAQLRRRW